MDKESLNVFYTQLDRQRQSWGISWHKLAMQAGVSSTVFTRMERAVEPNTEDLAKLRTWLENWGNRWS